jgi:antitoxin (DNA-binding transcriptional repressor) of toxin-antitoxin stability system
MSVYVDLHQKDLSLSLLQQYLQKGEDLILTDTQKPLAKIISLIKPSINQDDMIVQLREIIRQPAKAQLQAATLNTNGFCFNREQANER